MISDPDGTGDIADTMISASQMIYAPRMNEQIVYHTAMPYSILRKRCIIEKSIVFWYNPFEK